MGFTLLVVWNPIFGFKNPTSLNQAHGPSHCEATQYLRVLLMGSFLTLL